MIFVYFNQNLLISNILFTLSSIIGFIDYDNIIIFGEYNCNNLNRGKFDDLINYLKENNF